jgi:beta-galactosidase
MEERLRVDGGLADQAESTFAVRTAQSDNDGGILLNGRLLAIRAVRLYPDGGAFGAAVPRTIWERRLRTLKALGVNSVWLEGWAWGPTMADLCDRLGLLDLERFPETAARTKNSLDLGIDYLVEPQGRPLMGHGGGLLDRTGAVNPLGRQRQAEWQRGRVVSAFRLAPLVAASLPAEEADGLAADWTPGSLKPHTETVVVYTNCKDLDLVLNGKSLGEKKGDPNGAVREWSVPFAAGVITAVGRDGGRTVATNELRTAGKPVRLVLTTDRLSLTPLWDDVAAVRAEVVDAKGIRVPSADELITFKVSGPGLIAAMDNADTAIPEPFDAASPHAHQGRCTAYLRASQARGRITLTATAAGLKSGSVGLWAAPAQAR